MGSGATAGRDVREGGQAAARHHPLVAGKPQGGVDALVEQQLQLLHQLLGQQGTHLQQAALQIAQGLAEAGGIALPIGLTEQGGEGCRVQQAAL